MVKIYILCDRSIYQSKRRRLNAICFDVRYMYLALYILYLRANLRVRSDFQNIQ